MFRVLRYCKICLTAGLIGMLAGMAGQIYIFEFSDRNDVLMSLLISFLPSSPMPSLRFL